MCIRDRVLVVHGGLCRTSSSTLDQARPCAPHEQRRADAQTAPFAFPPYLPLPHAGPPTPGRSLHTSLYPTLGPQPRTVASIPPSTPPWLPNSGPPQPPPLRLSCTQGHRHGVGERGKRGRGA
eukprot:3820879-Pleurochrysis_carterae.AAC.1